MEFIKTSDGDDGSASMLRRIETELKNGRKVLWLICGGSGIPIEATVLKALQSNKNLDNLTVMLMDERYGKVGHSDSNWEQLQDAGCDFTKIRVHPVLKKHLLTPQDTVDDYSKVVDSAMDDADIIIGQFGLGADGHTAGMLPDTQAIKVNTKSVVGYASPPFYRITLTRTPLVRVDVAFVFAFGKAKEHALMDLKENIKPFEQLPAKIFHELAEVYIYNDCIGENQL